MRLVDVITIVVFTLRRPQYLSVWLQMGKTFKSPHLEMIFCQKNEILMKMHSTFWKTNLSLIRLDFILIKRV